MIITRTPYRVSLFGGGTDHPKWYEKKCGAVLSFSIDKYCYLVLRKSPVFFQKKYRITYSKVEEVDNISQIEHPVVREAFRLYGQDNCFQLSHFGDLPAGSGVGTSSAFTVGLLGALSKLVLNEDISRKDLAERSIHLEQKVLKDNVGSQDQIACTYGGFNYIDFGPGAHWEIRPIMLEREYLSKLEKRLVLLYSGVSRFSSDVSKGLLFNLDEKTSTMKRIKELADRGMSLIEAKSDFDSLAELLKEAWELKIRSNPWGINPQLQEIYELGIGSGASAGKLLGAGGGGFFLFWVEPEKHLDFYKRMAKFIAFPVSIDTEGFKVLSQ